MPISLVHIPGRSVRGGVSLCGWILGIRAPLVMWRSLYDRGLMRGIYKAPSFPHFVQHPFEL
jgi:hypothetical protein